MKNRITQIEKVLTSKAELKEVLLQLWDEVDLKDYQQYTYRLTCKIEDVIKVKGMATIH
jgi:hypothetical protein